MGSKNIDHMVVLVMALMAMALCGGVMAQSGCTNALLGMSSCLNFITGNSSTPSSSCCSQLGTVVQSQPQCLCSVLNGSGVSLGITINQTLALTLPGACNVQTPPISQCNNANGPPTASTPSPAASPEGSTPSESEDPSQSDTPSGSGSKTVPSTDGFSSNGSESRTPLHLLVFFLFGVLSPFFVL